MKARNTNVAEDRQIRFRIGINVGDVIIDGEDIYGDGINIASRLQELAEPDGICISATVLGQVEGTIDHNFIDGGAQQLKNITSPIRVYHYSSNSSSKVVKTAFRPFVDMPGDE